MFKKSFTTKQQSVLRSSDRKKFRAELLTTFPGLDEDGLELLIPAKEGKDGEGEVTTVKFTSHSGTPGMQYIVNVPLFFKMGNDGPLMPTVYALWRVPQMIPRLQTYGQVMARLVGGADLMLPGLAGYDVPWQSGDVVAVVVKNGIYPLAVGTALVGTDDLKSGGGNKGKGVRTMHAFGDMLWVAGGKLPVPDGGVPGSKDDEDDGGDHDLDDYEVVFEDDGAGTIDGVESLDSGSVVAVDRDASGMLVAASVVDSEATSPRDEVGIMEISVEAEMVSDSLKRLSIGASGELTPGQADRLLEEAMMTAVKTKLTDDPKAYPIGSSVLWEKFIEPCTTQRVDVHKSGYKKLGKFLKAMEKKGYVKLKERNGDTLLMSVNRKHPEIVAWDPPRSLKQGANATSDQQQRGGGGLTGSNSTVGNSSSNTVSTPAVKELTVVELYRASGSSLAKLWQDAGVAKDEYLTAADVKGILTTYINNNSLASQDPRIVKIDSVLREAVMKNDEADVEVLTRDSLLTRLLEKLTSFYQLTLPDDDPVIKKGTLKPVQIIVEIRQGRKCITLVRGVEAFGIDPDNLASELKLRCASSTTVTPMPGKNVKTVEVMVQGSKIREVCECLCLRYGVPFTGKGANYGMKGGPQSRWIDINDKTAK